MGTSSLNWTTLPSLPDAEGFAGAYAGVSKDVLLVAGGANFPEKAMWEGGPKVWHDTIFTLQRDAEKWKTAGKLPFPYGYGASVTTPKGVLCIGGCDSAGHRNDVLMMTWNGTGVTTTEFPPLPIALAYCSAVLVNDKVYVIGGCERPGEQDCTNEMWTLDLRTPQNGWKARPEIPGRARFLHQVAAHQSKIYVMGGSTLKSNGEKMVRDLLTEAWCYDTVAKAWSPLAPLPHPVVAAPTPAPVFKNTTIYLLGGDDGSRAGFTPVQDHPGFPNQSLAYHIPTNKWEAAGEIAAPRAVLPCVPYGCASVIINGELRPGKRSNQVWKIKPAN